MVRWKFGRNTRWTDLIPYEAVQLQTPLLRSADFKQVTLAAFCGTFCVEKGEEKREIHSQTSPKWRRGGQPQFHASMQEQAAKRHITERRKQADQRTRKQARIRPQAKAAPSRGKQETLKSHRTPPPSWRHSSGPPLRATARRCAVPRKPPGPCLFRGNCFPRGMDGFGRPAGGTGPHATETSEPMRVSRRGSRGDRAGPP